MEFSDQFQQDPLPFDEYKEKEETSDSSGTIKLSLAPEESEHLVNARKRAVETHMRSTGRSAADWMTSAQIHFGRPEERGAELRAPAREPLSPKTAAWIHASTMPPNDIAEAGTRAVFQSVDAEGFARLAGGSALAAYHSPTHEVWVPDDTADVPTLMGSNYVTHELAHALQNDMGDQRFVDEHKTMAPGYQKTLKANGITGDAVRSMGFEPSDFKENPHADTIDINHPTLEPIFEGSAEGYRYRHAPMPGIVGGYRPESFENAKNSPGKRYLGPRTFQQAVEHTYTTGEVIPNSEVKKNVTRLVGVLEEDLSDAGKVSKKKNVETSTRMAANYTDRLLQGNDPSRRAAIFEGERRTRHMAIYGQDIQGSLFPDITPETNQFGDEPVEIRRSPRGQAFYEGYKKDYKGPTGIERDPKNTIRYRLAN